MNGNHVNTETPEQLAETRRKIKEEKRKNAEIIKVNKEEL